MPILPFIQAGVGLAQSIIGGIRAHKAQKQLENLQTPRYAQSKGILDFYNQALSRYGVNPYQSSMYQAAINQANRATATGLGALQDRRSAIAGVSRLAALQNQNAMNAGLQAENLQNQRFGQLGQAAQMKLGEEMKQFQYNELAPYEKKYNLLAMKAGGGNQLMNAGLSNIFGGLQSGAQLNMAKQMYGGNTNYNPQNQYSGIDPYLEQSLMNKSGYTVG